MVVALELNRRGIGFDISEEYITQAKRRLAQALADD